jgi:hypothetical protein
MFCHPSNHKLSIWAAKVSRDVELSDRACQISLQSETPKETHVVVITTIHISLISRKFEIMCSISHINRNTSALVKTQAIIALTTSISLIS